MITGVETKTDPPFKICDPCVYGEYKVGLKAEIRRPYRPEKGMVNPTDGNIYEYG